MNKKILDHFRTADPILAGVLDKLVGQTDILTPNRTSDYFLDLCEAIINQQLSEKAGFTIFNRFRGLFGDKGITPPAVIKEDDEKLRGVGMSWSKVRFIKSLAVSFQKQEIDFTSIESATDEEAIAALTRLHGIGPWTAEMFLMFSLGRPDVFSHGDVGLMRAIQKLYG